MVPIFQFLQHLQYFNFYLSKYKNDKLVIRRPVASIIRIIYYVFMVQKFELLIKRCNNNNLLCMLYFN